MLTSTVFDLIPPCSAEIDVINARSEQGDSSSSFVVVLVLDRTID
jgi:hypothetical protein